MGKVVRDNVALRQAQGLRVLLNIKIYEQKNID